MSLDYLLTAGAVAALSAVSERSPTTVRRLDSASPDDVSSSSADFALKTLSVRAAAAVQTWAETEDLTDGEGSGDRLLALLVGAIDDNKDGELSDEEQQMLTVACNEAWNYLAAKGVAESDLDELFNSEDPAAYNAAGDRVVEFIADALPDGDEAGQDEIDDFAFGAGSGDAQGDVFDAVYKKKIAFRGGKKVMIRKRVSGTVRLSAAQKVAVRKMHMKSHGARAMAKRMKSMRVRRAAGK